MNHMHIGLLACASIALMAAPAATAQSASEPRELVDGCFFHAHDAAIHPADEADDHAWSDTNGCLALAGAPTLPVRTDVDQDDRDVIITVSHDLFLGGATGLSAGPEGVFVTYHEGITVCQMGVAFGPVDVVSYCVY